MHDVVILITNHESELPEHEFVTCKDCPDFDLCFPCFSCDEHGHHPGHRFEPVANNATTITPRIMSLCASGRGVVHQAICDGCEKASLRYSTKILCVADQPPSEYRWSAVQVLEMPRLGLLLDMRPQRRSDSPWPSFCRSVRTDLRSWYSS